MAKTVILENAFRMWVRSMLEKYIGNDADKANHLYLPIRRLIVIATEEVYLYLNRHNIPAPRKTTANILKIDPKTVSRTI